MPVPDYRRFIAYFYEYINGSRQKNAGFAKVELRNGMWRILFRLTTDRVPDPPMQVFGFVRTAGYLLGIPMGTIRQTQEIAEEWAYRAETPIGKGTYRLEDLAGIRVESGDGRCFLTVWDDEPVQPERFVLRLPEEKTEAEQRPETKAEQRPELNLSEVRNEDSPIESNLQSWKKEAAVMEPNMQSRKKEAAAVPSNAMEVQGEEAEQKAGAGQRPETEQKAKTKKKAEGTDATAMSEPRPEVPEEVMAAEPEAKVEESAAQSHMQKMQNEEAAMEPTMQNVRNGDSAIESNLQSRKKEAAVMEPNMQSREKEAVVIKPDMQNSQKETVAVRSNEMEVQREEAGQKAEETEAVAIAEPRLTEGQERTTAATIKSEPTAATDNWFASPSPVQNGIEELLRRRAPFRPFTDQEISGCVMILPCDIVRLQNERWQVGRSSFLQHGFYQYRHLLLGKDSEGEYVLGVPGIRSQQEQYMANMFGYKRFKRSATFECGKVFGYWWRVLRQETE